MQKYKSLIFGFLAGFVNSLFGAGGGMLVIPYLKSIGLSQKSAQASGLVVLLPLTAISTAVYLNKGYFSISDGIHFLPIGIVGAALGAFLVDKIPNRALNLLFSLFMLYSGIKMLIR